MKPEREVSFDRPPVVEMVLGVYFEPIKSLRNAHLGVIWKALGTEWSHLTEIPAQPAQIETFEDAKNWSVTRAGLVFTTSVPMRLQVRNAVGDRLVQIQNGGFFLNWQKKAGAAYPRYGTLRPEFDGYLGVIREFVVRDGLGEFRPTQWEVTYVNHIPRGTVWKTPEDWGRAVKILPPAQPAIEGTRFESLAAASRFEIVPQRGRVHVQVQHGRTDTPEGEEILDLRITARGPIPAEAGDGVGAGLDLGHAEACDAFVASTSDQAHAYWGIRWGRT